MALSRALKDIMRKENGMKKKSGTSDSLDGMKHKPDRYEHKKTIKNDRDKYEISKRRQFDE